jgi:hypothetical protein
MKPRYYFGDLTRSEGNAFIVMGNLFRVLRAAGYSTEEMDAVREDCMSGDYEHLLDVVEEHIEATVLYVPEDDPQDVSIIPLSVWRAVRKDEAAAR